MYGYIYITENIINGKKYIGQHKWNKEGVDESYRGSGTAIRSSIKKYGKLNFRVSVLERCESKDILNKREIYWIEFYDAVNDSMFYNISPGGDGVTSEMVSGEKHPFYGKHHSDESKKRIGDANRKFGENNPFYGKKHTEESKLKGSISRKGKCCGKDNPAYGHNWSGKYNPRSESVICLNTREVFECIIDAEDYLKSKGIICNVGHSIKRGQIVAGTLWMRYNDYINMSEYDVEEYVKEISRYSKDRKAKKVICIESGKIFNSRSEADRSISVGSVRDALRSKTHYAGGYHWMYYIEYLKMRGEPRNVN